MGRRTHKKPRGRNVYGILLLDKPAGITSNAALQEAKQAFKAQKAGHTGSLDPVATGLLPLCFGEATKASSFFLDADKRYETLLRLGIATNTGDAEGEVTAEKPVDVSDQQIEQAVDQFRGEIQQVPPMFSAVKRDGQPLYKLARQGIEVEREPRDVTVYELTWSRPDPQHLALEIHCSSGFYVRGLAQELGDALGCGAHVTALRRTQVGAFRVEDAVTLEQLGKVERPEDLDKLLISVDDALTHLPGVTLSDDAAYYLCRGQAVRAADLPKTGWVRLYAKASGFLGVGMVTEDGRVTPKRLFHPG